MNPTAFQLRTELPHEGYAHLRVATLVGQASDLLTLVDTTSSDTNNTATIVLSAKQWAELSMFAAHRASVLENKEEESVRPTTAVHLTNQQVLTDQAEARRIAFEEKVNQARGFFYDSGDLGQHLWPFDPEVVKFLVDDNQIFDSGVKVIPKLGNVFKLTAKGKTEHRRFLGVDDTL